MTLDSTDKALVSAGHAGDHVSLLALADKKEEEGHEDFAHAVRAAVLHGGVEASTGMSPVHRETDKHTAFWNTHGSDAGKHRLTLRLPTGVVGKQVFLDIPTHHPEIREIAARHSGMAAPSGEHWMGENPLYLDSPESLNSLRKLHGHESVKGLAHVAHGPGGLYSVFPVTHGHVVVQHGPTGEGVGQYDPARRHESLPAAVEHANRLANPHAKLSRTAAVQQQDTTNARAMVQASRTLMRQAGVRGTALPVVAASGVDTRPDVMLHLDEPVHPKVLDYVAAWHGMFHGSPSVVAFNAHKSGRDRLHVIHTQAGPQDVARAMSQAGVKKFSVHKGTAYVYDAGGAMNLQPVAGALNAGSYHAVNGTGRVVGAGEGADAAAGRAAYRKHIDAAEAAAGPGDAPAQRGAAKLAKTPQRMRNAFARLKAPLEPEAFAHIAAHPPGADSPSGTLVDHLSNAHPALGKWLGEHAAHLSMTAASGHAPMNPAYTTEVFDAAIDRVGMKGATDFADEYGYAKPPGHVHINGTGAEVAAHDPATGVWHHLFLSGSGPGNTGVNNDPLRPYTRRLRAKLSRAAEEALAEHGHLPGPILADELEARDLHHDQRTLDTLRGSERYHVMRHPVSGKAVAWPKMGVEPYMRTAGDLATHRDASGLTGFLPFEHVAHGPGGLYTVHPSALRADRFTVVQRGARGEAVHRDAPFPQHPTVASAAAEADRLAWSDSE